MAAIVIDGIIFDDKTPEVRQVLSSAGITLEQWLINPSVDSLLDSADNGQTLTPEESESILNAHESKFEELSEAFGYTSRDLFSVHGNMPGLDKNLEKFAKLHYHKDDEVRFILRGNGVFGFVLPVQQTISARVENQDRTFVFREFEVWVKPGDMIRVPRNTLHWFKLSASRKITAARYFITKEGWAPIYPEVPTLHTEHGQLPQPHTGIFSDGFLESLRQVEGDLKIMLGEASGWNIGVPIESPTRETCEKAFAQ